MIDCSGPFNMELPYHILRTNYSCIIIISHINICYIKKKKVVDMEAIDMFKRAHKEYYKNSYTNDYIKANPFENYFKYLLDSLTNLKVRNWVIMGRIGLNYCSDDDVRSNLSKLNEPLVEGGYWLFCYDRDTNDFIIVNFQKGDNVRNTIDKLTEGGFNVDVIVIKP